MSRTNKIYTEEFKKEAIKLAFNSASVTSVANELGIPHGTLHTSIQKAKKSGHQPQILLYLLIATTFLTQGVFNQKAINSLKAL